MIGLLVLMLCGSGSLSVGAEITTDSLEGQKIEDRALETLETEAKERFVWEKNWYRFHLWGDLKNLTGYNKIDDDSPLNPDNVFDTPEWLNKTELKLKLDGNIVQRIGVLARARLGFDVSGGREDTVYDSYGYLDQAYMTLELGDETITFLSIGRQRVQWGTGFYWNPVDTFNPRQDLRDIEKIEEGIFSFRADVAFPKLSLTGVFVPDMDRTLFDSDNLMIEDDENLLAGKLYTFLWNTDLTFYVSDRNNEATRWGASFSTVISDIQFFGEAMFWRGDSERQYVVLKSDRTTAFDPVGVTAFTVPSDYDLVTREGSFFEFVLGLQYTFSNDLTLISEYYHRSDGYGTGDMDAYVDFLKYVGGPYQDDVNSTLIAKERNPLLMLPDFPYTESLLAIGNGLYDFANLRRNYFHLSASWPYVAHRFDLGLDLVIGLDDYFDGRGGSLFLRPVFAYVAIPDWRFTFYSQFYIGAHDTEFGMIPSNYSLFGEIKYFF